ncbi:MAG: efflux RND transporter periplasmic adaptor subunit [Burkholderiaceae bacterium]|nr:MAG: efflux RND transporter periplasmic adaptor subunit [Burkholderiaceae bacterium]
MNTRKLVVILAAAGVLSASAYGVYQLGLSRGMNNASAGAAVSGQAAAPATDRKVLYWHDPMVPSQKFDKPGKSPFMDMQLVPVYADEGDDAGTVSISPRVQQNLGVRIAEVTTGVLNPALEAVGAVAYNERDVALVQARANGFVEKLLVRAPLDPVRKGQPLAELYVPDWVAAQEEFLTVKRMGTAAPEVMLDGARQRMRLAGMDDAQIRQVETSGAVHARVTITAPLSGVIAELGAREGMAVTTGVTLFRINGLATVWVNAEIPESAAAQVRPGTQVEAHAPALPGTVLKGRVSAILPEVSAATRTLKARVELNNPRAQLLPGMFATVNFTPSKVGKEVLLVPSEAVIQTGTRSVVMVAQGDGKFVAVEVEPGIDSHGQTEIRTGLKAGQKVVVSGQFLIDSEASLRGTATRLGETPQPESAMDKGAHP